MEQIRFNPINRVISAEWKINMEEDAKALFDEWITITRDDLVSPRKTGPCPKWVNTYRVKNNLLQSKIINQMGEQIAMNIDAEIMREMMMFSR